MILGQVVGCGDRTSETTDSTHDTQNAFIVTWTTAIYRNGSCVYSLFDGVGRVVAGDAHLVAVRLHLLLQDLFRRRLRHSVTRVMSMLKK